jgi:hypothetical protein
MVVYMRVSNRPARWSGAPRFPSKDLYNRAMAPVESMQTARRRERFATLERIEAEIKAAVADPTSSHFLKE